MIVRHAGRAYVCPISKLCSKDNPLRWIGDFISLATSFLIHGGAFVWTDWTLSVHWKFRENEATGFTVWAQLDHVLMIRIPLGDHVLYGWAPGYVTGERLAHRPAVGGCFLHTFNRKILRENGGHFFLRVLKERK